MLTSASLSMLLFAAAPVAKEGAVHQRTGVVFIAEKGTDAEVFAAALGFFSQANAFYGDQVLLISQATRKPLWHRFAKCAAEPACVAKRARQQKLGEVVLAQGSPRAAGGARLVFTAISTARQAKVREQTLELVDVEAVKAELARVYFEVVGITTPGFVTVEHAPPTLVVDGIETTAAGGRIALKPGPHTIRVGDEEQAVMVLPGETRALSFAALAPAPPPPSPPPSPPPVVAVDPVETLAATDAPAEPIDSSPPSVEAHATAAAPLGRRLLFWGGVGTGGLGLILAGVGATYGTRTSVTLPSGASQAEAKRLNREARDAASRANLCFGLSGAFVLLGGAAIAIDLFVLDAPATVGVAPSDGGAVFVLGAGF